MAAADWRGCDVALRMTGQILGGVPLAEAVKSQILVMFRQKNGHS